MTHRAWLPWATALFFSVGAGLTCVPRASGDAFDYSEDFGKFGKTPNFSCGGQGACGAVASMNSFTFLENQYPSIYDNKLTPNKQMDGTDPMDAQKFGFDGWQVGTNPARKGYYDATRPHNADFTDSFLQTKKDWINDYAPGTTVFDSWFAGSGDHDRKPTIADLAQEIKDKEDVEFFVKGGDGGNVYHVMTLTGVACDMNNACSIKFQDPNDVMNQYMRNVMVNMGMIQFNDIFGFPGAYTITAAFAESPKAVPEPSTLVILATAGVGLLVFRRRQNG